LLAQVLAQGDGLGEALLEGELAVVAATGRAARREGGLAARAFAGAVAGVDVLEIGIDRLWPFNGPLESKNA
jgi:hypothetical protein